jgi:hypothetical protein
MDRPLYMITIRRTAKLKRNSHMVRRGESSPGAGILSAIEAPVDIDRLVDNIL